MSEHWTLDKIKEQWGDNLRPDGPGAWLVGEVERLLADERRLDWLDNEAFGIALIHDDDESWTVSGDGMQNIREDGPLATSFFIEADQFSPTAREAIDRAMVEWEADDE